MGCLVHSTQIPCHGFQAKAGGRKPGVACACHRVAHMKHSHVQKTNKHREQRKRRRRGFVIAQLTEPMPPNPFQIPFSHPIARAAHPVWQ